MVWYGLAPKNGSPGSGSEQEAIDKLKQFWEDFVASRCAETMLNLFTYGAFTVEETEILVLGVNAPVFGSLNLYGASSRRLLPACRAWGTQAIF
jgi:hypothetical protein